MPGLLRVLALVRASLCLRLLPRGRSFRFDKLDWVWNSLHVPLECIVTCKHLVAASDLTAKAWFLVAERKHVSLEVSPCIRTEIAARILAFKLFWNAGDARSTSASSFCWSPLRTARFGVVCARERGSRFG